MSFRVPGTIVVPLPCMQGAGFRCLRSFFFLTYHLWGPRLCRVRIALAKKGNTAYVKFKVYKVYKKGLQSRSATASLLIKSNSIMEEKIKLLMWSDVGSRHIMCSCWGKQGCIMMFPSERIYVDIGAVGKGVLLILNIISIIQGMEANLQSYRWSH